MLLGEALLQSISMYLFLLAHQFTHLWMHRYFISATPGELSPLVYSQHSLPPCLPTDRLSKEQDRRREPGGGGGGGWQHEQNEKAERIL